MPTTPMIFKAATLSAALLLAACGGKEPGAASEAPKAAAAKPATVNPAKVQPADPALAALYQQSCFACHGTGAGGAPRTGSADWQPRLDKGMDTLLDNTINGFKGMPPLGMCMDCGEEEFTALIEFMAGKS